MRLFRLVGKGVRVLLREGPSSFARKSRKAISRSVLGTGVHMAVRIDEAVAADYGVEQPWARTPVVVTEGPIHIAWIMSPPSPTSGGHQNLFRFIDLAERAGHRNTIHFYNSAGVIVDVAAMSAMLRDNAAYPTVRAAMTNYDHVHGVESHAQAIVATGWETAYPAHLDRSLARRFYFVQDFEPSFYAAGSEAVLAENTYHFGFHGLTAGGWLSHKLSTEYGMAADHFDFAADKTHYNLVNTERRNEIFFYARPVTPRRGFELGVLALAEFARHRPDVTINLAGWDVSRWNLPFKFTNHSGLAITDLNVLYNRCAAGLVLSMSNMSLLPLELMSSGVIPVVNDAPNNRMVSDNPFIEYVRPTPLAISDALRRIVDDENQPARAAAASASVRLSNWEDSGRAFVGALERVMRG